ncbi:MULTISPECIES: ATP-dependent DNA ligase [unclassified Paenarthrobacter]|uniref:ATP-dependent DNA ligase n=1 Tax=unclassified Paenarthrobacter TaxID=2634190 RepID=UPI0014214905|nr:ATP-dependent DNA ligase [Paenarthrobacter sp. MSM-2-10-13]NHW49326.1 ATP-dependent DNA ligase [Paenarthrobacter sp. MSM-2-10-13]
MPPADQVVLVGLRPPVEVVLAKAVRGIPSASALPGVTLFEPKVDGYRLVIFRAEGRSTLWSRHGKELTRYFPELVSATVEMIPDGCVIDGEAVVWSEGRLNFEALQRRLSAGRAGLLAIVSAQPAGFIGFDVLGVAGHDARNLPLKDRRALLEELAADWVPPLAVSPQTTDLEMAKEWFEDRAAARYEGLVAKSSIQPYLGGKRIWLKSKKRSELDVVCGAVIGPMDRPTEIVAGLPIADELRIVGRSSPLKPADSRALSRWLRPPVGTHPWPSTVKGTTLDRFNRDASPVELTLVEPVVVEVAADAAWSGRSFRHTLRYLRVRPDLNPAEVDLPAQLKK